MQVKLPESIRSATKVSGSVVRIMALFQILQRFDICCMKSLMSVEGVQLSSRSWLTRSVGLDAENIASSGVLYCIGLMG